MIVQQGDFMETLSKINTNKTDTLLWVVYDLNKHAWSKPMFIL